MTDVQKQPITSPELKSEPWVLMAQTITCPDCKKVHTCDRYCADQKSGCKWVHHEFDDMRDQEYVKTQCVTCYNKWMRKRNEEFDREMYGGYSDDDGPCRGNCGFNSCGNCGY